MADKQPEIDQIGTLIKAIREGVHPVKAHETAGRTTYVIPAIDHRPATTLEIDKEAGLPQPLRKRGVIAVFEDNSFVTMVKKTLATANTTSALEPTIYVDTNPLAPAIVAVMNDHGEHSGWGDFRIEMSFRRTPQWLKWTKQDGQFLQQASFAEFIEDNLDDIVEPESAQMLEIVSHLEATRTTNFRSGVRLPSGTVQLVHEQNDQVKVGNELEVPAEFKIGLKPFIGQPSYVIPARFRYRIHDGKLHLGFRLQRLETMMEKIITDLVAAVGNGLPDVPLVQGLPRREG